MAFDQWTLNMGDGAEDNIMIPEYMVTEVSTINLLMQQWIQ